MVLFHQVCSKWVCHPLGELRGSWKFNHVSALRDAPPVNRRFGVNVDPAAAAGQTRIGLQPQCDYPECDLRSS
jgi:hypothetical protein